MPETRGAAVRVYLAGPRAAADPSSAVAVNLEIIRRMGLPIDPAGATGSELEAVIARACSGGVIVDALFGTGLSRAVDSPHREWIDAIGASGRPVVSIDIPSGLDADTGAVMGCCVRADHTLTFLAAKPGLYTLDGRDHAGEVHVLLGENGAGKSTLIGILAGMQQPDEGSVLIDGQPVKIGSPRESLEHGIGTVFQHVLLVPSLTVIENLMLGAYAKRARAKEAENLNRVLTLFPRLSERMTQAARTMSGGEQQMVAIGRALMSAPDILLLDEPSLGLSPLMCGELFGALGRIRQTGIGVLLVEQNAKRSLAIADRGYLIENGRIVGQGGASALQNDPAVQRAYLGAAGKH